MAEGYRSSHFPTLTLGSHADFGRRVFSLSVLQSALQGAKVTCLRSPGQAASSRQWLTWPGQLRGGFWPGQHILLTRVYIVCAWP